MAGWSEVQLDQGICELRLMDDTGFDGRCDCIYLTSDLSATPPPADEGAFFVAT